MLAFSIVLITLGVIAATGPVYHMTHHSIRHGHVASPADAVVGPHLTVTAGGVPTTSHESAASVAVRQAERVA